ncbi:MAG TPA: hypothetical protein VGR89_15130 [Puia sp.]|nr:hypothetical protein [Puia sp.]
MRLYCPDPLTGDDNMPSTDSPDDWEWIGEDGLTGTQRALRVLAEAGMLLVITEEELPD